MSAQAQSTSRFPMPIPFGWFIVAYSDEIEKGQAVSVRYFGEELAIFRGEDGKARVLEAYCKHMGANLGDGKVIGNTVACPFHAWQYDETGAVVEIPYAKMIPPSVKKPCIKAWPTTEVNNAIWVWYHPDNAAPQWEVEIYPEIGHEEWTNIEKREWTINTHSQEMAENAADVAHFKYVHGTASFPSDSEVTYDGVRRYGFVDAKMDTGKGTIDGKIENGNMGPGQSWTRFDVVVETFMMSSITPIEQDQVHVRFAFTNRKKDVEGPLKNVPKAFIKEIEKQLEEDKPVWERKRHLDKYTLCDGDGPIAQIREYFNNFYVDYRNQ